MANNQKGVTLVELMIAIALSSVLMLGVIQLFIANKTAYQTSDGIARTQESLRFAVEMISRDMRNAGFASCKRQAQANAEDSNYVAFNNLLNGATSNFDWDFSKAIIGYDGASTIPNAFTSSLPTGTTHVAGTDVLQMHSIRGSGARVQSAMSTLSSDVVVVAGSGFAKDQIVLVSDCLRTGVIFQITSNDPNTSGLLGHASGGTNPGNSSGDLIFPFDSNAEVYRLFTVSYFIANKTVDLDGDGTAETTVPSLYRLRDNVANAEELVEGVEEFQIQYGLADWGTADNTVNRYLSANSLSATDWQDVIAIRLNMILASTKGDLVEVNKTFTFNGASVTTSDKKIRQVAETVIGLRNRVN